MTQIHPAVAKVAKGIRLLALICAFAVILMTIFSLSTNKISSGEIPSYIGERVVSLFSLLLTFLLTYVPNWLNHLKIYLPPSFMILIILFATASAFMGDFLDFYNQISWWDDLLHTLSGVGLALIGFMMIYILNGARYKDFHLSPIFAALFTFTFALAVGVIWEIIEFCADWWFGMNMQRWQDTVPNNLLMGRAEQGAGLLDTMSDFIESTLGALGVSISGYFFFKRQQTLGHEGQTQVLSKRQQRIDKFFQSLVDFVTNKINNK